MPIHPAARTPLSAAWSTISAAPWNSIGEAFVILTFAGASLIVLFW